MPEPARAARLNSGFTRDRRLQAAAPVENDQRETGGFMHAKKWPMGGLLVILLSGCGGGGGDSGICRSVADGGASTSTAARNGANIDQGRAVFDGSLSSVATLTPALTTLSGATLRGTRGSGMVSSAFAGLALSGLDSNQTITVTISTYLDGVLVESGQAGVHTGTSQACGGICVSQGDTSFFGIAISRPFDAIGASLDLSGATQPLQLRELCVR